MKITYFTNYNASDIHNWSGNGYYIANTLEKQNNDLEYLNCLDIKEDIYYKIKRRSLKLLRKNYSYYRTINYVRKISEQSIVKINKDSDIIFSPGSRTLALLKTDKPKVIYTDACFAGLLDFYADYSNFTKDLIKEGHFLEQTSLDSASLILYSSEWAAETAIKYYNINPEKIKVVPFGANIENGRTQPDIEKMVSTRSRSTCHLLFVGVDWVRKGGNIALEAANILNKEGLKTQLHLVGVPKLNMDKMPKFVINHGYISKSTKEGQEVLNKLYSQSHFLIVPSRAEAYGLVFAEASSYGVPSLATAVGGIPTVVRNDINGKTFPLFCNASEYANYILSVYKDIDTYQNLAFSSFNEFEKRLNWNVAGETIQKHLLNLL